MPTLEEKRNQIRTLSAHIARVCAEYLYDNGLLEKWTVTDPERVDQYHKLLDLLDHHMSLYLKDIVPWDNGVQEVVEVIQAYPEDTAVSVKVKRYDFSPSVMQTARDILIFAVLP